MALLEPGVVGGADSGQRGELLPPQSRDATGPVVAQADLGRSDLRSPGAKEVAEPVVELHGQDSSSDARSTCPSG